MKIFLLLLGLSFLPLFSAEKPLARVGIITDTHVTSDPASCAVLKKAFQLFKKYQTEQIIHCGDVAGTHDPEAYRNYRNTFRSVFPGRNAPGEIFLYAWHDVIGMGTFWDGWPKALPHFNRHLEVKHPVYSKHRIAGFNFLTAPQNTDWNIYEKQIAEACRETPGKPVFVLDHVPAIDTVYNSRVWGDARSRKVLEKYPQAIQITGHVHGTFVNEQNIWQGNFTVINIGSTGSRFGGILIGNIPQGHPAEQAFILELFPGRVDFRRFDLSTGREYRPQEKWSVPYPFDRRTAPYSAEKRKLLPAPQFPAGSSLKLAASPDASGDVTLSFPAAEGKDGTFMYRVRIDRKTRPDKWEKMAVYEEYSDYTLPAEKRQKHRQIRLSGGFFDAGEEYRINVEPLNYFSIPGKALCAMFRAAAKKQFPVTFCTAEPHKDAPLLEGLSSGGALEIQNGFYQHAVWDSRIEFPQGAWKGPAGSRFRIIIDMHSIQPDRERQWTMGIREMKSGKWYFKRAGTPEGDSGVLRYVFEVTKAADSDHYGFILREGRKAQVRFERIKIERL